MTFRVTPGRPTVHEKPLQKPTRPRTRPVRRIALAAVSSLVTGSVVLSSGGAAVARPTPAPPGTHTTGSPAPTPSGTRATPPDGPTPPAGPTCTHTIVRGDTLSAIALRYLGDAAGHPGIYAAGRASIEAAAREHPGPPVSGTSNRGHWIFPGRVLTVPGATCAPATTPDLTPELPRVRFGEAVDVCGQAILDAVGEAVLTAGLKTAGVLPASVLRVVDVLGGSVTATGPTIRFVVETPDGIADQTFAFTEVMTEWARLLPDTPGLMARIELPALYCAQAALAVDQQLATGLGEQIRRALGLPALES
ncbi:LysM peptidoglycan-binding domain-containing protein [Streptomyces sp. NPDC014986]|uniref:LysM peptidoglycan-binding domain-containing protein n=1 Tax=Streptomyces sp. NPDC014986 TaxID=3364934 RepID=UPI003701445A